MARLNPISVVRQRRARNGPMFRGVRDNRGLTASAATMDLTSKTEARRVRYLRSRAQSDAWAYRNTVGEIGFAQRFLANCAGRMKIYPAIYPVGTYDQDPVPLNDEEAGPIPPQILDAAQNSMASFASGRVAMSEHMERISAQIAIPGEGYIIGTTDAVGDESWNVRSIDEIMVKNDRWYLREVPTTSNNDFGWEPLDDPTNTYIARFWTPHPQFKVMADSPMFGILESCEELQILRKTLRATGRSRLMSGILKWPKGLNVMGMPNDNRDPVATPEIKAITDAMMAPIVDEGVASAVVPLLVSGEEGPLSGLEFMPFQRPFDATVLQRIEALIGYMANGLDLPAQVLTGIADLNHWTAYMVDDNTWRYHVEHHVRQCVDAMAVGFLRAAIMGADEVQGLDPIIVRQFAARICVWYDPVELVTHPDKTQNALNLYDRKELSGESLRAAVGFTEDDKPTPTEFVARLISAQRTWPANVSLAVVAREDPSLTIPPITAAGMVPGIKAGLVQEAVAPAPPGTPPELPPGAPTPPEPTSPPVAPPAPEAAPQPVRGPAQSTPPGMVADDVTTMAVHPLGQAHPRLTPKARQLSAKLTGIDRDLRARLQVLASTTITRALERAGAQLRTKVRGSRALTASIRPVANTRVAFTLGPEVSAQYGLDPRATSADLTELKPTFEAWVMQAQEGALATAHQLAGPGGSTAKLTAARAAMATARDNAWTYFAAQLQALYEQALFKAQPSIDKGTLAPLDPETVVPTGVVRRTLAVAGGLSPTSKAVTAIVAAAFVPPVAPIPTAADDADDAGEAEAVTDAGVDTTTEGLGAGIIQGIVAQIGGGPIVSDLLSAAGSELANYTWVHGGGSPNPFEPHDDLDGQDFTNWDDDVLAVAGDWDPSGTGFYTPGDHDGCFPAGTIVSGPAPVGATLRDWQGEMVEVGFASGQFLTATPNHPILTTDGWVPAGELDEGHEVIRCLDAERIAALIPNGYQVPTRIEEVAHAFGMRGGVTTARVPVAPQDFHGDGAGSEVAVVRTDSDLRDRVQAAFGQPVGKGALTGTDPVIGVGLTSEGGSATGVERVGLASLGLVGSGGVGSVLFGGEGRAVEDRSLLNAASLDSRGQQALADRAAVNAEGIGKTLLRFPSLVTADKVLNVDRYAFSGHVFNLDTVVGWYVADGILVHNCGCDFQVNMTEGTDTADTGDEENTP